MAEKDNRLLYAFLASLTAPLGSAYAGYHYAKNQQRLEKLDPTVKREWDNAGLNILIGIVGGPISGALFGWGCGEQEQKIAAREAEIARYLYKPPISNGVQIMILPAQGQAQWQNRINQPSVVSQDIPR